MSARRRMQTLGTALATVLVATLVSVVPSAEATSGGGNGRIAFVSTRDGNREIYTVNSSGSGLRRLTWHGSSDVGPAWSPDGKQIAFSSDRSGRSEIWLMDQHGSGLRRLTVGGGRMPTWSPDGRRIAFSRPRPGDSDTSDIFVVDVADGTGLRNLTMNPPRGQSTHPAWSPDGRTIAYQHNVDSSPHDVYVMSTDGTGKRNLTDYTGDEPHEHAPTWSPSGARLAFHGGGIGCGGWGCSFALAVYVMDADGSDPTLLGGGGHLQLNPAWSPDGSRVAYEESHDIHLINADGSGRRSIVVHPAQDTEPDWQPVPIDFEYPRLGSSARRVVDPYYAFPATFTAESSTWSDAVVGIVKNSATSVCVDPASADQKLGTGRSAFTDGAIGRAGFPIRARFWYGGLVPAHGGQVSVAVDVQTLAGSTIRLRLYDSSGRLVGATTTPTGSVDGTCGYPGSQRSRTFVHATSSSTVASALVDTVEGGRVFVLDNFRVART